MYFLFARAEEAVLASWTSLDSVNHVFFI